MIIAKTFIDTCLQNHRGSVLKTNSIVVQACRLLTNNLAVTGYTVIASVDVYAASIGRARSGFAFVDIYKSSGKNILINNLKLYCI